MSLCGELDLDAHALVKKLPRTRVNYSSELYSVEPRRLVEGANIESLRRQFPYVILLALSFRTWHHLCTQEVSLINNRDALT